jgi:hypothetical protein
MADPVRDLNNFLHSQPGGSATKNLMWNSRKEGPEHDTAYHVTAVCKHTLRDNLCWSFILVQQSGESTLGSDTALQWALQSETHLCKRWNT